MSMSNLTYILSDIGSTINSALVLAAVWTINSDYAKKTTSALTIGQYSVNWKSQWQHNYFIDAVLKRAQRPKGEVKVAYLIENHQVETAPVMVDGDRPVSSDDIIFSPFYENRDRAIWLLDSLAAFESLETDLLDASINYKRNGYFCIIYTGGEANTLHDIKVIFRRLFAIYVININVFLTINDVVHVYTYFPFAVDRCHSSRPVLHVSFANISENADFTLKTSFFPDKLRDMHSCELVVTTFDFEPFVYVDFDEKTGALKRLHGIEGMLFMLLAEKMNFSIRILEPPIKDRGQIFDNGTTTGSTNMVVRGLTNITMDCLMYEKKRVDVMLASFSYMSCPLVLAIPSGVRMSAFKRLTKPFMYIIWSCISTSLLIATVVIFSIKFWGRSQVAAFVFGRGNRTPFTNLWNSLYGGSIAGNLPRGNFARYVLMIWLIYTMILRNAYSGELFLILQDGRVSTTLQTIREVVQANYTVYTFDVIAKLLKDALESIHLKYVDTQDNTVPKLLGRLNAENAKFSVTILEQVVMAYNQKPEVKFNNRVSILPEKLITSPIAIYMRHHSYLLHRINELLMDLVSAGMVNKFEAHYLDKNLEREREAQEPTVLTLDLLCGLFSLYIILNFFCLMIFVLECCTARSELLKMIVEVFNY